MVSPRKKHHQNAPLLVNPEKTLSVRMASNVLRVRAVVSEKASRVVLLGWMPRKCVPNLVVVEVQKTAQVINFALLTLDVKKTCSSVVIPSKVLTATHLVQADHQESVLEVRVALPLLASVQQERTHKPNIVMA